jgi:PIN domain nuclease of toxin-antitoxin system
VRVLLDTKVMVHAYIGDVPLSRKVYALLSNPDVLPLISAISLMEIAMKHEAGKLKMGATETRQATRDLRLKVIPFAPDHAFRLYGLPPHHRDAFDRMLIATALAEDIPLIGSSVQEVQGIESDLAMRRLKAPGKTRHTHSLSDSRLRLSPFLLVLDFSRFRRATLYPSTLYG